MSNKNALLDDFLEKISGGKIVESVYSELDNLIEAFKAVDPVSGKETIINSLKSMWEKQDEQKFLSNDGTQKDLDDLIAYVERKFN